MAGVCAELQRRNVIRMPGPYVFGARLVVQVAPTKHGRAGCTLGRGPEPYPDCTERFR